MADIFAVCTVSSEALFVLKLINNVSNNNFIFTFILMYKIKPWK